MRVLDAPYSIAWDQAGNRLTAMRAILVYLLRPQESQQSKIDAAKAELDQVLADIM